MEKSQKSTYAFAVVLSKVYEVTRALVSQHKYSNFKSVDLGALFTLTLRNLPTGNKQSYKHCWKTDLENYTLCNSGVDVWFVSNRWLGFLSWTWVSFASVRPNWLKSLPSFMRKFQLKDWWIPTKQRNKTKLWPSRHVTWSCPDLVAFSVVTTIWICAIKWFSKSCGCRHGLEICIHLGAFGATSEWHSPSS